MENEPYTNDRFVSDKRMIWMNAFTEQCRFGKSVTQAAAEAHEAVAAFDTEFKGNVIKPKK